MERPRGGLLTGGGHLPRSQVLPDQQRHAVDEGAREGQPSQHSGGQVCSDLGVTEEPRAPVVLDRTRLRLADVVQERCDPQSSAGVAEVGIDWAPPRVGPVAAVPESTPQRLRRLLVGFAGIEEHVHPLGGDERVLEDGVAMDRPLIDVAADLERFETDRKQPGLLEETKTSRGTRRLEEARQLGSDALRCDRRQQRAGRSQRCLRLRGELEVELAGEPRHADRPERIGLDGPGACEPEHSAIEVVQSSVQIEHRLPLQPTDPADREISQGHGHRIDGQVSGGEVVFEAATHRSEIDVGIAHGQPHDAEARTEWDGPSAQCRGGGVREAVEGAPDSDVGLANGPAEQRIPHGAAHEVDLDRGGPPRDLCEASQRILDRTSGGVSHASRVVRRGCGSPSGQMRAEQIWPRGRRLVGYRAVMAGITLVRGVAASGKTEVLLARATERYAADPLAETLVLVPTVRHGDQFRRRLVERCRAAVGLQVQTIPQLSRELVGSLSVVSRTVDAELLRRVTVREIEAGRAAYFEPIGGTDGLQRLLRAATAELNAEAVQPAALAEAAEAAGRSDLAAMAAIFGAQTAELRRRSWLHPAELSSAAADVLRRGEERLPPLVLVDGFQLFRGAELQLLEALAERADVLVTFDDEAGARSRHTFDELRRRFPDAQLIEASADGPRPAVSAAAAADREAQLRAMAREIKQLLADDSTLRPSDCAVVFRQITPYLGLARQVFAEYDLPLDPAAGERLASRPLGAWLRRLLHLALDGWRLRDLVAVLSSGFTDRARWGLDAGDVARIGRHGRERHLWSGGDALGRIVEGLRAHAEADDTPEGTRARLLRASDGLAAALDELRALLDRPSDSAELHAQHLEDALFGDRPLIAASARELPGVETELEALRGALRGIGDADAALGSGPQSFDAFVARLEHELEAPAVLLREAGGVLLAPMHTLHGLRFAHVSIGGLVEGEFPAPRTSTAILDREAREALAAAGLALPPEPRAAEEELWASVHSRADRSLSLWRSRLDDHGRPVAPSYYYDSLLSAAVVYVRAPTLETVASSREHAIACTQLWSTGARQRPAKLEAWPIVRSAIDVEQARRSFGNAGVFEGRLDAGRVPLLVGPDALWSASRIESYRTCAYQFFGRYALRLHELEEERDRADAATRGSVVHEMLQDALEPLVASGRPLVPETVDEAVDRLRSHGPAVWNRAPTEYGFGRAALWRLEAEETLLQAEALLRREAEAGGRTGVTHVIGAEHKIEASLPLDPLLRVTAAVDRLDGGDGLVVVVDYKSGRIIPQAQVVDGRRVQLQLYGYLAREAAGASRVIARYAWLNPPKNEWELDTAREEDTAIIEEVVQVTGEVRRAVGSGDFRVRPDVQPCPRYCPMIHSCRVNDFTRWKRWD